MFFLLKFSYFGNNENKIKPKSEEKKSLRIYAINTLKKCALVEIIKYLSTNIRNNIIFFFFFFLESFNL